MPITPPSASSASIPGLNITGYGVLECRQRPPQVVRGGRGAGKSTGSLTKRLVEIHEGVADVIASLKPDVMALEELYSHYDRPRTAILMGHARGVICLAAAEAGIPVLHYSATQIKRILTGSGRAPKVASATGHPARTGPGRKFPTRPTWPTPWPWHCVIIILKTNFERQNNIRRLCFSITGI